MDPVDREILFACGSSLKRHPNLWFNNGRIIFMTEDTMFRLHRTLLSMDSPVFADLLDDPQQDRREGFERLQIMEVPDNDTDFTHLLCYIYDHKYYQGGTKTTFEKISSLLRMSTKYQMDDLRGEIIAHLALAYPSTLENYVLAVDTKAQLPLFPPFHGQHFAVVALARETDASILLPAALWRSACMTTRNILEGVTDPDDDDITYALSFADIKRCIIRKCALQTKVVRMETILANLGTSECTGISPCKYIAMRTVLHYFSKYGKDIENDHDFFVRMDALEVWRPLVCDGCRKSVDSALSGYRSKWWSSLPKAFGLPEWNDLRDALS
ncbi:hypothetical protein BD410DRAFT_731067 [Rickenella mellea]|uniref:BTB domain-containing protein n=1 Tax=Rickenella mellea TaxID=50990 RepID=A0A4Y7PND2_9AGAM|nr:hypothetical protein BD410DRAFT_731067 [Rickenella mellea]